MSKILFAIAAICMVQIAFGRIAREAPAQDASPWLDAWNLANETIEQFHRSFLDIAGVQNDDELWTKARQQFTTYEASLRSNVAQLEEETKPLKGKAEELLKAFSAQVTEVSNELKAKNPELFSGDTKKLQEVAERSFRTIVDQTQKLRTRLEAEGQKISPKIEETLKAVYDNSLKTAQDFKTQAEAAINQIQKKN